jgi:hypothetical protein
MPEPATPIQKPEWPLRDKHGARHLQRQMAGTWI